MRTFLLSLLVLVSGRVALAEEGGWKAGVASVEITPRESMWMAGYASRTKPSEGKVHDLFAKALTIEDRSGRRLVFVTLDLIGITRSMAMEVSAAAAERYNLPRESLLFNASHTHCGPCIRPERVGLWGLPEEQGPKIDQYTRELKQKIVGLIGRSIADRRPARLFQSHSAAGFARNRRFPTDNGYVNKQYDNGPVDHDVPVLRVTDPTGEQLRAVLFGYSCHNTTLSFFQFCGDYAGFAQANLQEALPGTTAMFLMGTGGDQNPYPRGELELCQQHGKALADAVLRALKGPKTEIQPTLKLAFENVLLEFAPLPPVEQLKKNTGSTNQFESRKARYLLSAFEENGGVSLNYPCPIQVVRLGNEVLLIAIGGEVVVDYGRRLKRDYAGPTVWVAGYSNDVFGYLPSLRVLREGGYEAGGAMLFGPLPGPFAESVEDLVIDTVDRLVKRTAP